MVKIHNNKICIENNTGYVMIYRSDWFDSGRLADHFQWPSQIRPGDKAEILCYEKNWALSGCSGYTQYQIDGFILTIGFSNPSAGNNKVGAGISGKKVWDDMTSNEYQPQKLDFPLSNIMLRCECTCTGGETNNCNVKLQAYQRSSFPGDRDPIFNQAPPCYR